MLDTYSKAPSPREMGQAEFLAWLAEAKARAMAGGLLPTALPPQAALQAEEPQWEPASITVARFRHLCEQQGLEPAFTWVWNGRNRDGVLTLKRKADDKAIHFERYRRGTSRWSDAESDLQHLRAQSPRHLAIKRAVVYLKAL
ncbi:hypothetical protein JJQ59_04840 [Cupriavidus necator]|uniref:Uncharacterized protein n=1 Tax=Cupriavidus necator TaxID=106590 RepID=A0A367P6V9_CUPNE|nr:hypothetical protein [Cupriavidus necator]QQX85271.1 hypothetical protein JJQ59_04840 [Cupriavidus necator]RCJ03304.1 hypothetical protein DDK22_38045 [Cupriavidus necator]